jgi:Ni,Fe-hydrogenase III component G
LFKVIFIGKPNILNFLNEDITEKELEAKLKELMNSKELTTKIKGVVDKEVKSDKELENMVVDITRNALTQLFKTLWTKRNFWQSQIKNKSA